MPIIQTGAIAALLTVSMVAGERAGEISLHASPVAGIVTVAGQVRPETSPRRSPVADLIRLREELSLTEEQVQRLESLNTRLGQSNDPLFERLESLAPRLPSGRPPVRGSTAPEKRDSLQALREQIRTNQNAAMREARDVLTAEQLDRLRTIRARRGGVGRGMAPRHPGRPRAGFGPPERRGTPPEAAEATHRFAVEQ